MEEKNLVVDTIKVCSRQVSKKKDQPWNNFTEDYMVVIMHAGRTTQYVTIIIYYNNL